MEQKEKKEGEKRKIDTQTDRKTDKQKPRQRKPDKIFFTVGARAGKKVRQRANLGSTPIDHLPSGERGDK